MREAAADLEFETAARLRDEIRRLEAAQLGLPVAPVASSVGGQAGGARRGKKDTTPRPFGPGGGGYERKSGKGGGRARR
jgi:excinuclease ABC subunit B